jgi:hypothetical protein
VNLVWGALIVAAAASAAVAAMLLVRRRAPEGSYFSDGDRASGVFGGHAVNPWGVELFRTIEPFEPGTPSEEAAHGKWLDQTSEREGARVDRLHEAVGVIPTPVWIVALVIFVYMLFVADSAEGAATQALLMASVATAIVALLLLIRFLDSPFKEGVGGIQPVAMERALRVIDDALGAAGLEVDPPCTEDRRATT